MSLLAFTAVCFPVVKGMCVCVCMSVVCVCVCPLHSQPGTSKPLPIQQTATILSKLHHLSRCQQCNRRSAAAALGFFSPFLYFSLQLQHFLFFLHVFLS